MRIRRSTALAVILGLASLLSNSGMAGQDPEFHKKVVSAIKKHAVEKGNASRADQGSSYFCWVNQVPQGWNKAYFQVIELAKGTKYLSLKMTRKTSEGTEMLIITDPHLNGTPDEAYRGSGKTMAEADRMINIAPDKHKVPVTKEMFEQYNEALEQVGWELGVSK